VSDGLRGAPELRERFARLVRDGRIHDLSHAISSAIPVHPFHRPYTLVLHRRHGDTDRPGGASFANEVIVTPAHIGTHIDALGHFSRDGLVHGGARTRMLEGPEGLRDLDAAHLPLLWHRGVLLDVARARGVACLAPGEGVEAPDLDVCAKNASLSVEPGDVVCVRTGWARHWQDPETYNGSQAGCPGIGASGAEWLAERGVLAAGTDTGGFEVSPPRGVSVHAMLLVDAGIYIIENLNLDTLAEASVAQFLFVALPLRLAGATASPIRPLALT
jgi:kynurenine formamidase